MPASANKDRRLAIQQVSAIPATTQYFETCSLRYRVTNNSPDSLLIQNATLQFSPDLETSPDYVDASCGFRLAPHEAAEVTFVVTPTPMYFEDTNRICARFDYCVDTDGRLGEITNETHEGFYLIIKQPASTLGDVFISFKQPENSRLALILERYVKRAGFVPHLFVREPNIGADQWKHIEQLIRTSHSAFIVWARRTDWGGGVEQEIDLCRTHGVREILLIEHGVNVPPAYKGTSITYQRFDPADPSPGLSAAVSSLREQLLRGVR
jgi:hypothetical protein